MNRESGRGLELGGLKAPFQPKPFCENRDKSRTKDGNEDGDKDEDKNGDEDRHK